MKTSSLLVARVVRVAIVLPLLRLIAAPFAQGQFSLLMPANHGRNVSSVADFIGTGGEFIQSVMQPTGSLLQFFDTPEYAVGGAPYAIATADFNGDGKPDLAVANRNDNTVNVLLGNGDGTFQARKDYVTGYNPTAIAIGDFNGDGRFGSRATGHCRFWSLQSFA